MRAARRDEVEWQIVMGLRQLGATVQPLHGLEAGVPDLLVGYHGANYLLEVKGETGRLSLPQIAWHQSWGGSVAVVRSIGDALSYMGIGGQSDGRGVV